jgi:Integrase core domain
VATASGTRPDAQGPHAVWFRTRVGGCGRGALVEDWRIGYNTVRPHNALGSLTPTDDAKAWATSHPELS